MLAWRLAHDPRLAEPAAWVAPFVPRPGVDLDRDPIALLLGAVASGLALVYLLLAAGGARARWRAAVLAVSGLALVVVPTAAFVGLGVATDRPYGQDGGVVQLPLAVDKILAGESPYGADYSQSVLGRQARVSRFWEPLGGNPILRHHAYLPGTHLVMLPFQLASRALFGCFDPRFVTLLFWALAAALAARLPAQAPARLSAAALVAVNPLLWWHQVFGANDLVFVAELLGAALLLRSGRPLGCAALLGLACATKQLAWPFAPFFLAALSGAAGLRDFLRPPAWRRLAAALATAAGVFLAVVAPVAALDLRAFWGDIVVYNMGLAGGDAYPFGGTPGIGVANLVIYFGAIGDLRDSFPLGLFYLLLVPLGLGLVRVVLRQPEPGSVFLAGSVALVASLYVSRVVHPNYLMAAAALLPLAALLRRREADVAAVPLLLLALAVEIAERGVFRGVWEQAAAAGLPERLSGTAAALLPRAGPHLTEDPLGLAFSALAAGFAVVYLSLASLGVSARWRSGLVVAAACVVVALPAVIVTRVGERTGLPRAQDPWPVRAWAGASVLAEGRSPIAEPRPHLPRGREAWTSSFRLEPPAALEPERPLSPPGGYTLAALVRPFGGRDPRPLALACLLLLGCLLAWRAPASERPLALAVGLLAPPLALGAIFGSGLAPPLLALVATFVIAAQRPALAGLFTGLAGALLHHAWLAAAFLLRPVAGPSWRVLGGAAAGYVALVGPVAALAPAAFFAQIVAAPQIEAGIGLVNLVVYRADAAAAATALALGLPLLPAVLVVLLRSGAASAAAAAAAVVLAGLWLAPGAPPDAVGLPLVFAFVAATAAPAGGKLAP